MSEAPQDTPVISVQDAERISEMALQSALDDLGRIVDGNGLHKSAVRISEKHLKLGQTSVELKFRLSPDLKEERMGGRIPKGEPVKSAEDINDLCAKHSEELYQDPAMQQRMMKEISEKDFALEGEISVPLKEVLKQYHYFESCHVCKGNKKSTCNTCHGKSTVPCNMCRSLGTIPCEYCNGMKTIINQNGDREPCLECEGYGNRPCHVCQKKKTIPCPDCNASGYVNCNTCKASGEETVIKTANYKLQMEGRITSGTESKVLFDKASDRLGGPAELIKQGHITLNEQYQKTEVENGMLYKTYTAFPPFGEVGFSLNGKRVDSKIFGQKGMIFTEENFLDSLIKSGISALNKIAKGPMATSALFTQARSFKIIRDVTNDITRKSKKKILSDLQKNYPIGLSEKYTKAIITFSDKALKKVMIKPRWMGAGIGTIIGLITIFAWFQLSVRPEFLSKASLNFQLFVDGTLLGGAMVLTSYIIKMMTQSTLKKVLGDAPPKMPKAGDQALISAGVLALIFLACAATSATPPLWWAKFF